MRDLRKVDARCEQMGADGGGIFTVLSPVDRVAMVVIASFGMGWDHVSVSRKNRCPNWTEMDFVKRMFFEDYETAVQFHVPLDEHISMHPTCLHLWRPNDGCEFPRPPSIMVGVGKREALGVEDAAAMVREAIASGEIPQELL